MFYKFATYKKNDHNTDHNPSAVGHYTVHINLTFLESWTHRRVAAHAHLCNTLPSSNQWRSQHLDG